MKILIYQVVLCKCLRYGKDGLQEVITIKRYVNDEFLDEQIVASNIKKASIDKVIEIGTGKGTNNFELKVGNEVYTTASVVAVMEEANTDSEKIINLNKGTKVKVLKILDNRFSYITSDEAQGYVLSECLSNINPNAIEDSFLNYNKYTKAELLAKLNFNMELNKPSGFSLTQFREVLQYNPSDKNNIFTNNADYFYYAEQEYGINGIFLASIAIHESAWGTSKIATDKNNLFGYMAYDDSAYLSAKNFGTYSEGIDLLARVLIKYYLNPSGAMIYSGNIAEGKYYSGKTVSAVNKRYASDSSWASKVYKIMQNLYNAL